MVLRRIQLQPGAAGSVPADRLVAAFAAIRAELNVPGEFAPEVLAEAEQLLAHPPQAPEDLRDVPFVTVDPPGSRDLDQALHLSLDGDGLLVRYAIADVGSWVRDGGPLAAETWRRGQTLYAPDGKVPLHPSVLSDGAASLLPDVDRTALVWQLRLDAAGEQTEVALRHAQVRSRLRLDYASVQAAADAVWLPAGGTASRGGSVATDLLLPDVLPATLPSELAAQQAVLLRATGLLRLAAERRRGGASLPLPTQEVDLDAGRYRLSLRPALPAEDWNAQLSLLTGMAAAQIMLEAKVGVLRTLPAPDPEPLSRFRRQVAALGVSWSANVPYGQFLRSLDPSHPEQLALLHEAAGLFRGAAYTPFDGELPEARVHAAVAAPYAHVTAPLRRLVDRFGLAVCLAVTSGTPVPEVIRAALPRLPAAMQASDRLASALERRCLDVVEAALLERAPPAASFEGVVVQAEGTRCQVQLVDPPVLARCDPALPLGRKVRVRVVTADVATGTVRLAPA